MPGDAAHDFHRANRLAGRRFAHVNFQQAHVGPGEIRVQRDGPVEIGVGFSNLQEIVTSEDIHSLVAKRICFQVRGVWAVAGRLGAP